MSIHETMGKVKYVPVLKNTEMLADIDVGTYLENELAGIGIGTPGRKTCC